MHKYCGENSFNYEMPNCVICKKKRETVASKTCFGCDRKKSSVEKVELPTEIELGYGLIEKYDSSYERKMIAGVFETVAEEEMLENLWFYYNLSIRRDLLE